jgi:RNA polymerase sigma-70 factor (family 1)
MTMNQYLDFDQKLYNDLRCGKEYAFATVFDRYNRLLYTLAYRFLKSGEEAEDAVQYVFMKLWEQRGTFSFESGVRSLLFTILKNYILNELRHRSVVFEKYYEISQQMNDTDDGFLSQFEDNEFKKSLYVAIGKLPPQKQKICLLKIEYGLSNQEIADKMRISVPTVKSHYTQAIKMLRQELESLIVLFSFVWIHLID